MRSGPSIPWRHVTAQDRTLQRFSYLYDLLILGILLDVNNTNNKVNQSPR